MHLGVNEEMGRRCAGGSESGAGNCRASGRGWVWRHMSYPNHNPNPSDRREQGTNVCNLQTEKSREGTGTKYKERQKHKAFIQDTADQY